MKYKTFFFFLLFFLNNFFLNAKSLTDSVLVKDINFEQALIKLGIDSDSKINGSILVKNIDEIRVLDVHDLGISDLSGIEIFKKLQFLDCSNNHISKLNLSQNVWLQTVICNSNVLTDLNVTSNVNLFSLNCAFNFLKFLDVPSQSLNVLNCSNNELKTILVSSKRLEILNLNKNKLSTVDLSALIHLREVYISGNKLNELQLQNSEHLVILDCSENVLSTLNLCSNRHILELNASQNSGFSSLKIAKSSEKYLSEIKSSLSSNVSFEVCN